ELEAALAAARQHVADLEAKLRDHEMIRRRMHNTILELKGNIRVFCRVRPPLPREQALAAQDGHAAPLSHIHSLTLVQTVDSVQGDRASAKRREFPFQFDRVFRPESEQSEVFDEISQLVQSALDGYNVCIFAYGQTGSGKTFTMEGPEDANDLRHRGMIPRAVAQIFEHANELKSKGWTYTFEITFLEIYNEQLRDLLAVHASEPKRLDIKHLPGTTKTTVTEATVVQVASPAAVTVLLNRARANRAVAATNMNERSSRSHSVFTLRLAGKNQITGEDGEGVLNLIDLAGSERLSASGSTGDRLKETQAINKSLSSLGDVIMALANKDPHIPYRNSKLTYLLQNSLGGNSKTLMFVNISPLPVNLQETLCSLRFATKVNNCQIGTARKNVK
ncbi:hypothetical protein CXG81DRAFT_6275, partial [Caulochytrium protostelioides]